MMIVRDIAIGASLLVLLLACSEDEQPEVSSAGQSAATAGAMPDETQAGTGAAGSTAGGTGAGSGSAAGSSAGTAGSPAGTGGTADTDAGASTAATGGAQAGSGAAAEPYAHVVAVATSGSAGAYTFDVSIESADIDCTQFANWWEVLAEDGSLLYRRILQHSHTDENGTSDPDAPGNTFTRNGGPVPIDATQMVVVRAHMSPGGYNGMAMRGSASGGFSDAPDIGADFAPDVEDDAPQPEGCQF